MQFVLPGLLGYQCGPFFTFHLFPTPLGKASGRLWNARWESGLEGLRERGIGGK